MNHLYTIAAALRRQGVLIALLAGLVAVPAAQADVEPNNNLVDAEGPLAASTDYPGSISESGERDWYVFYVRPSSSFQVDYTTMTGSVFDGGMGPPLYLYNTDGTLIGESDGPGTVGEATPPGGIARYFIRVGGYSAGAYQFRINSLGVTTGPRLGQGVRTSEPNNTPREASGPLLGGIPYRGANTPQGSNRDDDWFFFYAKSRRNIDVSVTGAEGADGVAFAFARANRPFPGTAPSATTDQVVHVRFRSASGVNRYNLKVFNDNVGGNNGYEIRLNPPSALSSAKTTRSPACTRALRRRTRYQRLVSRYSRGLAHARSRGRRRFYTRHLSVARHRRTAARRAVARAC